MQKFKYKIVDAQNRVREGETSGDNIQVVGNALIEQGYTILELHKKGISFDKLKETNIGGVPFKDKVIFIRQMSFMINAGIPLAQALEISLNQNQNHTFKNIIEIVLRDVQTGLSFARALEKHAKVFDPVIINLVRAGEESGKLDVILERVADDMEKKQEFNGKVKGALIYPIVIMCAIVVVVVMLLVFMIPEMSKLFEDRNAELPYLTRMIVSVSDFLRGIGGVFTLIIVIASAIALFYYRKTASGRIVTDQFFLKMPIFGQLVSKSQVASFCRTFSMLVSAGVPILDALKLVADSSTNMVFTNTILDIRKKVEKGIPLSQPFLNTNTFPQVMGHMIRVGEETGQMDDIVSKVGIQYAKEVDQMASNLTKLMEPLILIVMGVIIGILAIAVYLPIFSLGTVVSGIK